MARILAVIGLAGLAVITLASPGATRMHAWPWSLAYAVTLLGPALALVVRALDRPHPLALPTRPWLWAAAAWTVVVLASAWASPHRGPSLLWSAPLLAGPAVFLLIVDWLGREPARAESLPRILLVGSSVLSGVSLTLWAAQLPQAANWLEARNPFPLGHANYTAGLALLLLPNALALAWRSHGRWRAFAGTVAVLLLAQLFFSGSRAGWLGLAALAAAGGWCAPLSRRLKVRFALAAGVAGLLLLAAHPRTRATLFGGGGTHLVAASDGQRAAMLTAGARMGAARPLLGWGAGTTPLVYPLFRGGLAGGPENVLQLHSLPVQVWAELGAAGCAVLAAMVGLLAAAARTHPVAAVTLLGYGVFALTDWQLDVPIFVYSLAALAALLAPPAPDRPVSGGVFLLGLSAGARWLVVLAVVTLGVVTGAGRRDPAPELNVRALALARDPAQADAAAALLRDSLALNPDQEIAHFNLGWLLVTRDPMAAARHFHAAARLVPDKGGVYFGLGLAHLNQGRAEAAARAFALEGISDPAFLASGWWREPAVAAQRERSRAAFSVWLGRLGPGVAVPAGLRAELLGVVPAGPERVYRRERTGYPVLMRNLDLPAPRDLFDVRDLVTPPPELAGLPAKGWLPGPVLLALLEAVDSPKP